MSLQNLRAVLENNLGPKWTVAAVFETEIVAVNDIARTHICKQDFDGLEDNYEVAFLDEKGQTVTITEAETEEECCSIIKTFSDHASDDKEIDAEQEPLLL